MKLRLLSFLMLGFILTSSSLFAQNVRVLGYFPQYRATAGVQYDKLTDVAYSFINPNANGTLKTTGYSSDQLYGFDNNKFTVVKDGCANAGTNLWIALGGADDGHQRDARLNSVSGNAGYRSQLATDLVQFCIDNGVYGIAVDWEFPNTTTEKANHVLLLEELNTKIAASTNPNLKISVAVGGEYAGVVNHLSMIHTDLFGAKANLVDEWHLMAYDFPASYDANHSSLTDAEGCMDGWAGKGMSYGKMLLGVPFYARNANRTGETEYNNLSGTASTNYTSDLSSGWYYNGKTTLEAKIDLAVAKGALGILIWDLGQDRNAGDYSLLDAINTKVNTVCPIAKPNLGPDKGVCAPNSVTLDPGVTGGGLQFTWTKDGGSSIGSNATLDVSDAGTYKVSITNGSCTKEDEIIIVSGSPITTTGASGCDDETLTLTINGADNAKTYDWYDQDVSGTKVNTGTTYADMFATSATFYVEEKASGVNTYTSAYTEVPANYAWDNFDRADYLKVEKDLTLKSVRVFAHGPDGCTFKLQVLKEVDNTVVGETASIVIAPDATKKSWEYTLQDVNINLLLTPGEYFVTAKMTQGSLAMKYDAASLTPPVENGTIEPGVYELGKYAHRDFGSGFLKSEMSDPVSYVNTGHLYKYVIETGANASCGRTPVSVSVINCGPPEVTIVSPTNSGQYYTQAPLIDFEASVIDGGSVTNVVFEVWKGNTKVATLPTNSSGSTYTATWQAVDPGTDYEFKVIATDNDANDTEAFMDFDVDLDVSAEDVLVNGNVGVYPNPASDNFNIAFDLTTANEVSVEVVNSLGAVVYTDQLGLLNAGSQTLNVKSELTDGLYFVNVKVGNEVVTTPLNVVK